MSNIFKTTLLLTGMTLLLMLAGRAFGGQRGMVMALVFAAVINFVSYFFSDKIALACYRAQPVTREDLPRVYNIVERLAQKVSLPMPKVYVIPSDSPNAFATGRNPNHASVAVTQGILGLLNDEELEGVLAHELGHVRNRDISSVPLPPRCRRHHLSRLNRQVGNDLRRHASESGDDRGGGGGIAAIAHDLPRPVCRDVDSVGGLRAPGNTGADDTGAHWTRQSLRLASALAKIDAYSRQRPPLIATPIDRASLYHCAVFRGSSFGSLFSTHPPTAKRIERLTGRPAEFTQ